MKTVFSFHFLKIKSYRKNLKKNIFQRTPADFCCLKKIYGTYGPTYGSKRCASHCDSCSYARLHIDYIHVVQQIKYLLLIVIQDGQQIIYLFDHEWLSVPILSRSTQHDWWQWRGSLAPGNLFRSFQVYSICLGVWCVCLSPYETVGVWCVTSLRASILYDTIFISIFHLSSF